MLPLPSTDQDLRCPGFCDCRFPSCIDVANHKGHIPDLVKCRCGEDSANGLQWQWHQVEESDAQIIGRDIIFHPTYSQGTAIVRGEQPLQQDKVHFWEMRVITALAGTDVMFGIGTDRVNLEQFKFHFVSALGTNAQSWGYSYNGKIQHCGDQLPYGQKFSQGCLVGIYLDRTRGHLEFYLNRRSLGVAYTNIPTDPHVKIYPMVCSTAAKSVIRLINSTSQPATLQLRAFEALSKQPQILDELRQMPGLNNIMQSYWFLAPPVRYSRCSIDPELDLGDEAVLPSSKLRLGRKQKYRETDDVNIDEDLYANAHKIPVRRSESGDEEYASSIHEFCDEYFHYLL
ncbi:SPRY domain-containing SOCS box protein 3 [Drosophila novamexicana]|uniref:SPRY domain-containing SOCS box protein 3 n=1 Tax=Drosophila novamexicana TaxID=47314 RepID=UPI0011E596EB|nr:SPRY domain-containing SOCS box protein 3 [Drosophila novamexicana]